MGKIRRYRKKLHTSANENKPNEEEAILDINMGSTLPINLPNIDLFKGIHIKFAPLEKVQLPEDVLSLKSSEGPFLGANKVLSKKQKLALRRAQLLRKIDTVNQLKKERKMREIRKTTAIIGDTNPLHDALPSLQDLLKNKDKVKISVKESEQEQRSRGIEKAKKRKKKMIQGITLYKQILNNKVFQKSPMSAISEHIKHKVQQEQSNKK